MKPKNTSKKHDVIQNFKRLIHRGNSPRGGLSLARQLANAADFPKIVKALGSQPIYKSLFALLTFPAKLEQVVNLPRLIPVGGDSEFVWTASVLKLFSDKINGFLEQKDAFLDNFVSGKYVNASSQLDLIEKDYGQSLWLIQYRLQLLQLTSGLEAQKDYVERILATEGIGSLSAWLSYLFSLRCEENVSFAKLQDELDSVLAITGLGDYVMTHVIPYDLSNIGDPVTPVIWEEPHSIIDRYETLISMLQVRISSQQDNNFELIELALDQLKPIHDIRLHRIRAAVFGATEFIDDENIVLNVDRYTIGDYHSIPDNEVDLLEIIARKRIHLNDWLQLQDSLALKDLIIYGMIELLSLSSNSQQQRLRLKKIALSIPKHSYAIQIAAFLERRHDFVLNAEFSTLDRIAALNGPIENPWWIGLISSFAKSTNWQQTMRKRHPSSPSIALRVALASNATDPFSLIDSRIPEYRKSVYKGHIEVAQKNIPSAIAYYSEVVEHSNTFVSSHAKKYLYDALFAAGRYPECLALAVEHILSNNVAVFGYKIDDLAKLCLKDEQLRSDINLAILLHLNVVHISPRWEKELSDIFENVLSSAGVERPSDLIETEQQFTPAQEIYFLRHISTPRILDDTTCFDNVDEIEAERIAICQHLLTIDPSDKDEYLSEIRGLTRDTNVAHLLQKVQSSKIYVDEAGLRQSFETSLLDTYLRYQRLLDSPALAYQAEKLTKRLEEMLLGKGGVGLKELKLPASEREALFETLLDDFSVEFAFNPAYGLDTHVSTTIRHGAFEGHVRTPFAAEDLLCRKRNDDYVLPRTWDERLEGFSPDEMQVATKLFGRFTSKIEELILVYLRDKIRVREGNNHGMFVLQSTREEIAELRETITKATDYNSFLDKFFEHIWELVDDSMTLIRSDLQSYLLHQVNLACDNFATTLDTAFGHDRIAPIVDAIVRAQTEFQSGAVEVAEWFRRPQDLSRDPFDFEVAVHVAIQQITNCYVSTPLEPTLELNVPGKIEGKMVDGICEIFFILLQNVILHSGIADQTIPVYVCADRLDNSLIIVCENELSDDVDIEARTKLAFEATGKYERDNAMKLARVEGGSGLSKIWRISEYDLRVDHRILLEIDEHRVFRATVILGLW